MTIPLVVILGPTAVGKSQVAVEVAGQLNGEVVVADSMQVYRGMDIGTAKLTGRQKVASNGCCIAHHLVDVVTPAEPFSVAEYQKLARQAIAGIFRRGKMPLLVGGTALYLKAVTEPVYNFPPLAVDPSLRQRLKRLAVEQGAQALHRELAGVDPAAAARLHPNDVRRVVRALEIYYLTGRPASARRLQPVDGQGYDLRVFGLDLPRPLLYQRINQRVEVMLAQGWVEEVRNLLAQGFSPHLPAMQGLGYRHVVAYLFGQCNWQEMVRLIQRDTRHFAKRQMTWFRRYEKIHWLDVSGGADVEAAAREIATLAGRD